MLPNAVAKAMVAPVLGLERVTRKLSFGSGIVSPFTLIVMTFDVSPAAKLTVFVGT